jgi:hypothetical protein
VHLVVVARGVGSLIAALFGSLATVSLGVAATIGSLVQAFKELGGLPAEQKAPRLSELIAEAMNSTWWGLALGQPALLVALISFVVMARSRPPRPLP